MCVLGSRSSRRLPLVGGLTASGQNITLSLRKSCAPLVAAMEGERECRRNNIPPTWTIDEANDACFIVRDANGQALAYVYYED